MNGKVAKRLVRLASQIGSGRNTYVQDFRDPRTIRCGKNSPREVYKRLKMEYRRKRTARTEGRKVSAVHPMKLRVDLPQEVKEICV